MLGLGCAKVGVGARQVQGLGLRVVLPLQLVIRQAGALLGWLVAASVPKPVERGPGRWLVAPSAPQPVERLPGQHLPLLPDS